MANRIEYIYLHHLDGGWDMDEDRKSVGFFPSTDEFNKFIKKTTKRRYKEYKEEESYIYDSEMDFYEKEKANIISNKFIDFAKYINVHSLKTLFAVFNSKKAYINLEEFEDERMNNIFNFSIDNLNKKEFKNIVKEIEKHDEFEDTIYIKCMDNYIEGTICLSDESIEFLNDFLKNKKNSSITRNKHVIKDNKPVKLKYRSTINNGSRLSAYQEFIFPNKKYALDYIKEKNEGEKKEYSCWRQYRSIYEITQAKYLNKKNVEELFGKLLDDKNIECYFKECVAQNIFTLRLRHLNRMDTIELYNKMKGKYHRSFTKFHPTGHYDKYEIDGNGQVALDDSAIEYIKSLSDKNNEVAKYE